MVNAIATTSGAPSPGWTGGSTDAAYLSGFGGKLGLKDNLGSWGNQAVYFNIYVRIPFDAALFHETPIEAYRYLYS